MHLLVVKSVNDELYGSAERSKAQAKTGEKSTPWVLPSWIFASSILHPHIASPQFLATFSPVFEEVSCTPLYCTPYNAPPPYCTPPSYMFLPWNINRWCHDFWCTDFAQCMCTSTASLVSISVAVFWSLCFGNCILELHFSCCIMVAAFWSRVFCLPLNSPRAPWGYFSQIDHKYPQITKLFHSNIFSFSFSSFLQFFFPHAKRQD